MKNYYQILGLPFGAAQAQIKSAYRKLAFQFHPDKNNGDKYAHDKFIEITEAYTILSNKDTSYFYHLEYTDYINYRNKQATEESTIFRNDMNTFTRQAPGPASNRDIDFNGILFGVILVAVVFILLLLQYKIAPFKEENNTIYYNNTYKNPYNAVSNNVRPITKDEYYLLLFQEFSETHDSTLFKINNIDSMINVIDSINGF